MVIHNIYIISSDGTCPLSLKLGSIEADSDRVAGVFTASQTLWKEITGETPKMISFQNTNAYIRPFSTTKKGWYLVLVTDAEKQELIQKVEDTIMKVVEENKGLFEEFFADTTYINMHLGNLIVNELTRVPCPHINQRLLKQVCECSGEQVEGLDCNLVSMASCKAKIGDYQKKNSQVASRATHIFG